MEEADLKLHLVLPNGSRNTSVWTTADFSEVAFDSAPGHVDLGALSSVEVVHVLFRNEAARKAYRCYIKYSIPESDETSTLSMIGMDAFLRALLTRFITLSMHNQRHQMLLRVVRYHLTRLDGLRP